MSGKQTRRERRREAQAPMRQAARKVNREKKAANTRAKYGPARKPAPVIVKSLATAEVLSVSDQSRFKPRVYADALEERARAAGYDGYQAYLKSPHWLALRERVLSRDRYKCCRCPRKVNLAVHHQSYAVLGAETMESLETLCDWCHRQSHGRA